jgi:hypothetical protein
MARRHDPYYDHQIYHYAALFSAMGDVSALCYRRPHAINLTKGQAWVWDADRVTCWRCRKALRYQHEPLPVQMSRSIERTNATPDGMSIVNGEV